MLSPSLLVKLSESEKKALIIVAVIFAFIFVVIGLIIKLIKDWYKRKGEDIDNYMYDLIKYGVIKTPNQFRNYVNKRERRNLYLMMRIPMRILIIVGSIYVICNLTFTNFETSWTILKNLAYNFEWPTTKVFGMSVICDWPTITKYPEVSLTIEAYITYISSVVFLVCSVLLIRSTLIYNARISRSTFVSTKAFKKNLENGVDIIHE